MPLREYGCRNMVSKLRAVLVRSPEKDWGTEGYQAWGYFHAPDLKTVKEEHMQFVQTLKDEGIQIFQHDTPLKNKWDATYVYDPAFICDQGAITLRMGKKLRRGEETPLGQKLAELGIPTVYTLHDPACLEGGDTLRLTNNILAIGETYRTNSEGIRQLRIALEGLINRFIIVQLPHYKGPAHVLHLMSLINLVDHFKAVIYPKLIPVSFLKTLKELNFDCVETPSEEFLTQACNVLALEPGKCLMVEGNPITRKRLEAAGCEVLTYKGEEITQNGGGGPTCLTLPLLRHD
ncbi:MAG: dimethylarginine dimethylaminohydrolase family protein [Candidatus Heimdallarchaeota archaeon]